MIKEPTLCPKCKSNTVPAVFADHVRHVCTNKDCKHSFSVFNKSSQPKRNRGCRITDEDKERVIKIYRNCLRKGMKKMKAQDYIIKDYHYSKMTIYSILKESGDIKTKYKKERKEEPNPEPTKSEPQDKKGKKEPEPEKPKPEKTENPGVDILNKLPINRKKWTELIRSMPVNQFIELKIAVEEVKRRI